MEGVVVWLWWCTERELFLNRRQCPSCVQPAMMFFDASMSSDWRACQVHETEEGNSFMGSTVAPLNNLLTNCQLLTTGLVDLSFRRNRKCVGKLLIPISKLIH